MALSEVCHLSAVVRCERRRRHLVRPQQRRLKRPLASPRLSGRGCTGGNVIQRPPRRPTVTAQAEESFGATSIVPTVYDGGGAGRSALLHTLRFPTMASQAGVSVCVTRTVRQRWRGLKRPPAPPASSSIDGANGSVRRRSPRLLTIRGISRVSREVRASVRRNTLRRLTAMARADASLAAPLAVRQQWRGRGRPPASPTPSDNEDADGGVRRRLPSRPTATARAGASPGVPQAVRQQRRGLTIIVSVGLPP